LARIDSGLAGGSGKVSNRWLGNSAVSGMVRQYELPDWNLQLRRDREADERIIPQLHMRCVPDMPS
jgi:hypothetical protein